MQSLWSLHSRYTMSSVACFWPQVYNRIPPLQRFCKCFRSLPACPCRCALCDARYILWSHRWRTVPCYLEAPWQVQLITPKLKDLALKTWDLKHNTVQRMRSCPLMPSAWPEQAWTEVIIVFIIISSARVRGLTEVHIAHSILTVCANQVSWRFTCLGQFSPMKSWHLRSWLYRTPYTRRWRQIVRPSYLLPYGDAFPSGHAVQRCLWHLHPRHPFNLL